MSAIRSIFRLLICLVTGATALAHDPGLSSAHITRTSGGLEVQLAFAWSDLASLTSGNAGSVRPTAAQLTALAPTMAESAGGLVQVSANGISIHATRMVLSPGSASPTEVVLTMEWEKLSADAIEMEFPIIARMPFGHRMMLTEGSAAEPTALLDARHATWELRAASANVTPSTTTTETPARASWSSFVLLGVEHILTGFDHLCFLLALLLVATRFRDVLTVVTTFTVAHSLTLAAAALGRVSLSSAIVEPLIAVSIVYIGLENLFLRRQPRHRLALVFAFGLIHGFGFAGALTERLPGITGIAVVPPLLGFNVGVELGQLAVAAALVPLIRLARTQPGFSARMQPACSLLIASAGFIWLLQRV